MRTKELLLISLFLSLFFKAQVGINTTTPDPSSVLDVQFKTDAGLTPKGMLTPRMTTVQRGLVVSPANGLLVYDTDFKAFFYYDLPALRWTRITSDVSGGRTNFKRLKSTDALATVLAAELAAGGGNKYQLNTNTLYEINGTVTLDKPIDLNNAYVQGIDSGDDMLISTGNIFDGATGGTIKGLTLRSTAGSIFNLNGTSAQNLIFRDCIVLNSASVGTISNMGLVFLSIVQLAGNTTGITYNNITRLLLSNIGWFGSNTGTFEKYTGTFSLIQKQGGFSEVNGSATGFDVSANPIISGSAVMESVVFTGSNTAGYINPYPLANRYANYNFSNPWTVDSPGIPKESDDLASGNLFYNSSAVAIVTNTTPIKLPVSTDATRLFRTAEGTGADSENRLIYKGESRRSINVIGSISFTATGGSRYTFSIYKNNVKVVGSDVIVDIPTTNDRQSVSITGTANVVKNDFLEIYIEKGPTNVTPNQFLTTSYNLIFN